MEITTRHTPAYGVARLQMQGGESARVESGAMMAMRAIPLCSMAAVYL